MDNYPLPFVMARKFQRILGINFFVGEMTDLLGLCAEGHFIVVPAAPALVDLPTNAAYRESVEKSDFAITDSAFMVLLWRFFTGQHLPRISGLKLLRGLLETEGLSKPGSSVWIMPSQHEMDVNLDWLNKNGHPIAAEHCFIAPVYGKGPISDPGYYAREISPRLGDDARYVGHLDHRALAALVGGAVAALCTPRWEEPFGLVVAEALACGTPVAAFARGGIPEILDETCGVLARPDDSAALAEAAIAASRLSRRAVRHHAERTCDIGCMVVSYERLYRDVVAERAARRIEVPAFAASDDQPVLRDAAA